mmetsp:Transcript_66525/g.59692  ORF Transcript_66525/g.59692 Transcript_66525/m.59692 type:complete len:188 (-) Transcript_66525:31-594(-)
MAHQQVINSPKHTAQKPVIDNQKANNTIVAENDLMAPIYDQTNDPLFDIASKNNAAAAGESYDKEAFKTANIEEVFSQYCDEHKKLLTTAQNKLKLGGEFRIGDARRDVNNLTGDKHQSTLIIYTEGDKIWLRRQTNNRDSAISEQVAKASVMVVAGSTGIVSTIAATICCCFLKRKKDCTVHQKVL